MHALAADPKAATLEIDPDEAAYGHVVRIDTSSPRLDASLRRGADLHSWLTSQSRV
jgi:hypothetical protein